MLDVVILTDDRFIDPKESNEYIQNVQLEDQLVMTALINKGLAVKKVSWSDPNFDWRSSRSLLFRTTWDYAEKFNEFSDWLMNVALTNRLINSYDLISWNLDKHYLGDLKRSGVHVVESYFIEPKDTRTLADLHKELGWKHTVLKPAVSASAKDTFQLTEETIADHESRFAELITNESMMLQPFQSSIVERGEVSLVMIGGEFQHGILKKAKRGDFRVQDDFGGTVEPYSPNGAEIQLAKEALEACETLPVYARVDVADDLNGVPAIMELELIEPEMWFRNNSPAADRLADEIAKLF